MCIKNKNIIYFEASTAELLVISYFLLADNIFQQQVTQNNLLKTCYYV